MESHGEHKREKAALVFWMVIGFAIGIIIGASTGDWGLGLSSGMVMGAVMAFMATKPGLH